MVRKLTLAVPACILLVVFGQAVYGGKPGSVPPKDRFEVIAHRGLHVRWLEGTYDRVTGCEATHILTPNHDLIENTLDSIGSAFEAGATIVEVDIRVTGDERLVVFHDWDLSCRTDGKGQVSDHPLSYLKTLDIGYGYTHDGGQSFPLRGKGLGKMPTLIEVLDAFPDGQFLIDHKDGTVQTADLLVQILQARPPEQQTLITYWGPDEAYAHIQERVPAVYRLFEIRPNAKRCLIPYLATLGLGGFPDECRGMGLVLPPKYLPIAWGWPYRFLSKLDAAGAKLYVQFNTDTEALRYAHIPVDGIVTDSIEIVGRHYNPQP